MFLASRTHALAALLLLTLLVLPLVEAKPVHSSVPPVDAPYTFTLHPRSLEHFIVDSYSSDTVGTYSMTSNASVTVAVMTAQNFSSFRVARSAIVADSLFYANGTTSQHDVKLAPGSYELLVYAFGLTANVTFSYQVYPNNPFSYGPVPSPEAMGITSFGLTNQSGVDSPYAIRSTDVVGLSDISAMSAFNATAEQLAQVPDSSASLQLNSVLLVNEENGQGQVYWCQDTPTFVTATSQIEPSDNVWNFSASGYLGSDTISSEGGGGSVYSYLQNGLTQYYYDYEGSNSTYTNPLGLVLLENATAEPGTGVLVQFGLTTIDGGTISPNWFDNVTINDPTVKSAYFFTDGNDTTPDGLYYDTELAYGGDANGAATNFTAMSASLGLYYTNGTDSHTLTAFPSYFDYAGDTFEAADNLQVTYSGNGQVQVSPGISDFEYLGAASGNFSLSAVESALSGEATTSTSGSSSLTSTTTSASLTSMTSTTSTTSTSPPNTTATSSSTSPSWSSTQTSATSTASSTPTSSISAATTSTASSSSIDLSYLLLVAGVSTFVVALAIIRPRLPIRK